MPALKHRTLLFSLLLLAAVTGTYAIHFQNGFHFDDMHTVVDNPYIRSLKNLPRFFQDPTTFSVLPQNRTWRPFVSASLAFDYWLGSGYKPFFFHLSTFLIFLLQLALMIPLFRAILDRASPTTASHNQLAAWLATAWYGLHPVLAETVNYVIQRGDIYAACGVVAALALFVLKPGLRKLQLYLLPFAFALLSKPPALVFPVILFLYLYLFEESENPKRVRASLVATLPSFIVCGLLLWVQAALTPKTFTPSIISPWSYRITQPYVWLRYLEALFLPLHLNIDTDLRPFESINVQMIAGIVFTLLLLAAIVWNARKPALRPISFGLSWFVISQLPTSLYPLSEVENDHRMYLAFIGLVLAVVWALSLLTRALLARLESSSAAPLARKTLGSLIALLLCAYAGGTFARNRVWRDEETLWKDCVEKSPTNGRGLMNYGLTQMAAGRFQEANDLFTRALAYTPNYPILEINLGIVNDSLGRAAESERHFQRALQLSPGSDEAHLFYGRTLLGRRKLVEAKREEEAALSINPSRLEPHHLLIRIDQALGDESGAHAAAEALLRLAPDDPDAAAALQHQVVQDADYFIELSLRYYQQGLYRESEKAARDALKQKPDSALAFNNIAAAAAAEKRWDDAIAAAAEAVRLSPDFQLAKNNLAWAKSEKAAGHK